MTSAASNLQVVPKATADGATAGFLPDGLKGLNPDLARLKKPQATLEGRPLEIDLTLIDEDPNQPRKSDNPGFAAQSLGDLAHTIRERGIKTPLSLRKNPEQPGKYLINHGARRYRAAKLAGLTTIPAFIDHDYREVDQIIENLQRDELTPREIAEFIQRELAKGFAKGEIAKRIGKSNAFISQHLVLMDLPEPIATAYSLGRVQDVTAISELVKLHQTHATEVEQWLCAPDVEVTRNSVKQLRQSTTSNIHKEEPSSSVSMPADSMTDAIAEVSEATLATGARTAQLGKMRKAIVLLKHKSKEARLLYDRRPEKSTCAWIRYEKGGKVASVELSALKLVGLIEG